MPFCTKCGSVLASEDRFCGNCGHTAKPGAPDGPAQSTPITQADADPRAAGLGSGSSTATEALACPKCGLFNPPGSSHCDCGYEFSTGKIDPSRRPIAAPLSGVGGWLAVLTFGLLILGPLMGAGRINTDFVAAERQNANLRTVEQWADFKALTWSAFWGFTAISVYAGWGLLRGRSWSVVRRARVSLWVVGPAANIVLGLAVPVITLGSMQGFDTDELVVPFMGSFIASVIIAAIWTLYLSKSRRVRATYGIAAELRDRYSSRPNTRMEPSRGDS